MRRRGAAANDEREPCGEEKPAPNAAVPRWCRFK